MILASIILNRRCLPKDQDLFYEEFYVRILNIHAEFNVRPPKFVDLTARAYNAVFDEFIRSFSHVRFRPSEVSDRHAILRLEQ